VLIHNTLPHQHHSEMEDMEHSIEHQAASNVLEYLQLAFHLDMGGDHLENFEKTTEVTLSAPMIAHLTYLIPDLALLPEQSSTNAYYLVSDWHSPTEYFWNETSFRGPPTA
jgi:hypothetical protein